MSKREISLSLENPDIKHPLTGRAKHAQAIASTQTRVTIESEERMAKINERDDLTPEQKQEKQFAELERRFRILAIGAGTVR